jgi:hypothetical protein
MPINKKTKIETPKKRGRPSGSKNKTFVLPDLPDKSQAASLVETLKEWDRMEAESNKTDWEMIARKQEDRLKAYIAENEELAKICIMRWEEIQHLKYLVSYLDGKNEDSSV